MPDLPWRTLNAPPNRRPFRLPVKLSWRLQRLRDVVLLRLSSGLVQAVSRIRALRWMPRWALIAAEQVLISSARPMVFDGPFYLDRNPDVKASGQDPLRHYLRHGWLEGRAPNASFDDPYYRSNAGLTRETPVSALAHYLAHGRTTGLVPAPNVDIGAWHARNPEIAIARVDPYGHFLKEGCQQLLPPGPPAPEISLTQLATLGAGERGPILVDVVMPVFSGRAETLSAILHVLTAPVRTAFELVVIDDCGPDADLRADIDDLAARGLITLIRQPGNCGFVAAINRGMACNSDRDVIWLNADTQVYAGWLDRLREAAYSAPNVATVTPLSNNATLCSYPRIDSDNAFDLECEWTWLARTTARVNAEQRVEVPTAVGFCTYVRRDAIDVIGTLDEQSFGRGYGEENDFSRRAIAAGWLNLAAADVLVRHFGGVSFGAEKASRVEHALAVLDRRYPDYHGAVLRFLKEDPLHEARHTLDLARLRAMRGARNVLIITHALGGGTAQYVTEEIARLRLSGVSVFLLSKGEGGNGTARLGHVTSGAMPTLEALDIDGDVLWRILATLNLSEVQIHHLIDFSPKAPAIFGERLATLRVPYQFMMHDYFAICPRINMCDLSGMYCGEPSVSGCRSCLLRRGSAAGRVDIVQWRERYRALLRQADRVTVPDRDGADRLHSYFPELQNIQIMPHEPPIKVAYLPVSRREPGPLRVAVLGAIGPIKGVDVLFAAAMRSRKLVDGPEFTVIGYTHNDTAARACGISVTGAYDNAQVDLLIEQADPDVIWIPSIWPETYCYTLSIALRSGRPIAGFAIGAIATRLRDAGTGHLMPLSDAGDPERLLQALALAAEPESSMGTFEAA